jgi:hypothetical protein
MTAAGAVSDWDEARDPMRVPPPRPPRSLTLLGPKDRLLLEELSDGQWIAERDLRRALGWGRVAFLLSSVKLIATGWVVTRSKSILSATEYRLSARAWQ